MFVFEMFNRYIKCMCFNKYVSYAFMFTIMYIEGLIHIALTLLIVDCRHWPMMSVANAYVRAANFHYKNIKDASADEFDTKVMCTLVGRATRWEQPPTKVVDFLFGEWLLLSCERV